MAKNGFFSKIGSGSTGGSDSSDVDVNQLPIDKGDTTRRLELMDNFEQSGLIWFWATDASGKLIYLSDRAAQQVGKPIDELLGRFLSSLFTPDEDDDPDKPSRPLAFLLSARNSISELPVRVNTDASALSWSISGKPQFDEEEKFIGYRGSAKDITAERERQRDASRMAQFDSLTGLANRHRMNKRLTSILTAYKSAKRSCALMMLDLDRFKQVNDTLGHPAGDELLKQVAQRLERIIGQHGEIGRLGGDEFQVILPDVDDRGQLGDFAHRIIQMVSQPYSVAGSRAIIGTSVGIAIAPYDGVEQEELVSAADLALYSAKGGGRGQYRFYSSDLKDGAKLRKQIEEDLRDALDAGQIELHYQPIVQLETQQLSGFEALMRWNHPDRGWISPAMFIPIAEETNIINDLGEWALQQGCKDAANWPCDARVAINVSANQFSTTDLPSIVSRALSSTGLDPERLELELTESVFVADPKATQDTFTALKKLGVRLALDDFGTGYSSLGYLRNAPFDKIKIDQSFVRGATEDDNNNAAIISAIVSLAEALDMETVAEGVEALDELDLVKERGASHVQGHVFSQALSPDEVLERLNKGNIDYDPVGPAKHRSERKTVFRNIGVIHEDHRYQVMLRNLSKTGARIEGLLDVPVGTDLVLDLGDGQLVVSTVRRSKGYSQGLEFETPLISDGAEGLCTRHRISPYALAAAGMPLAALPEGSYMLVGNNRADGPKSRPRFLEVDLTKMGGRAA